MINLFLYVLFIKSSCTEDRTNMRCYIFNVWDLQVHVQYVLPFEWNIECVNFQFQGTYKSKKSEHKQSSTIWHYYKVYFFSELTFWNSSVVFRLLCAISSRGSISSLVLLSNCSLDWISRSNSAVLLARSRLWNQSGCSFILKIYSLLLYDTVNQSYICHTVVEPTVK